MGLIIPALRLRKDEVFPGNEEQPSDARHSATIDPFCHAITVAAAAAASVAAGTSDGSIGETDMSLFGSFRKSTLDKPFSTEEAANGILLAVIFSDGEVTPEEVEYHQLAANRHPLFRDQPIPDFNRMLDSQIEVIKHHGWMKLAEKSAQDLPGHLRATLFALAVDFVLADGRVEAAEEQLIERIRELLCIDQADAKTVIAVLCAKNGVN